MPKIETDKVRELHSIALTLKDILKELKRFNVNYEKTASPCNCHNITSSNGTIMLLGKEDISSTSDNTENRKG